MDVPLKHILQRKYPAGTNPLFTLGCISSSCPLSFGTGARCEGGLHFFSCGFGSFPVVNDKNHVIDVIGSADLDSWSLGNGPRSRS